MLGSIGCVENGLTSMQQGATILIVSILRRLLFIVPKMLSVMLAQKISNCEYHREYH